MQEDAESIDSLTLSAPFNHPYLADIKPMSTVVVCKRGEDTVFEGRALDNGTDFYNTHTWTCESAFAHLKDTIQSPYDHSGTLRGLLEYFISEHNKAVEDKKKFTVGNVTVTDDNDYVHYSSSDYTVTMDAIRQKLINTHGGYLRLRYTVDGKVSLCVEEKNRSWCSSSNANDQRAGTIECASDKTEPYAMNSKVYDSLVKLCTDICRRNGKKKLLWIGERNKTLNYTPKSDEVVLTVHR